MQAFIVVGPESSGTRLVTKILIAAGCNGSAEHYQEFDDHQFVGDPIVWRRSLPHGSYWPSLRGMITRLRGERYGDIQIVITTRSWRILAESQVKAGYSRDLQHAYQKILQAYKVIFTDIPSLMVPYAVVDYHALTTYPKLEIPWLTRFLGLPDVDWSSLPEIVPADGKYGVS